MITQARIVGASVHLSNVHQQAATAGTPEYIVTPEALAHFLPCPSKWQAGYHAEWAERHRWGAVLSTCVLMPDLWPVEYVCRPDSYNDSAWVCPQCKSEGKTKLCSKCGGTRRKQTVVRAWAGAATPCKAWTAAQEAAQRTILSNAGWSAAMAATARIRADEPAAELLRNCAANVHLVGEWTSTDGRTKAPLATLVSIVPDEGTALDNALAALRSTPSVEHRAWLERAHYGRLWMKAAVDLAMYNLATEGTRSKYLVLLSESEPPFEVGRRELSAKLLQLGREDFEAGMELYARCLAHQVWPTHDTAEDGTQAWTLVDQEPWLGNTLPRQVARE